MGRKTAWILRMLWPEICPFCGKASRQGICPRCRQRLDRLAVCGPLCMRCGRPLDDAQEEYCCGCRRMEHAYDSGRALWLHAEPARQSVYRFKFHNQRAFAACYADEMAARFSETVRVWDPDIIVPVPLHPAKKRKRGYNQAALLARELGKRFFLPVSEQALLRVRNTRAQKTLDPRQRRQNLAGAFAVPPERKREVRGRTILIVDDIYTTGSTIDAAARALRRAGAEKLYYLSINIGHPK